MGLSPKNRDDRVRVSNAASLLYTLQESKTPVEISLILGSGEECGRDFQFAFSENFPPFSFDPIKFIRKVRNKSDNLICHFCFINFIAIYYSQI